MCHTSKRNYKNCKANPKHTYHEDVMCDAGKTHANGPTWCARLSQNNPHYSVVGSALRTSTSINCQTCNKTVVNLVSHTI